MILGPLGEKDRRDRGILTDKLLLSRKGSVCVCVYVSAFVNVIYLCVCMGNCALVCKYA